MKTNRTLLSFTLFFFLIQTLMPPALLYGAQGGSVPRTQPVFRSMDAVFDTGVPDYERLYITDFIQSTVDAIPFRKALGSASDDLTQALKKDTGWFNLDIRDKTMADLLEGANSGRKYLTQTTAPAESRLQAEQRRMETALVAGIAAINQGGPVPGGFMDMVRSLSSLYDLQDQLWEMKISLLFKIMGLSNNVLTNYLVDAGTPKSVTESLKASLDTLNTILGRAYEARNRLDIIEYDHQAAEFEYSKAVGTELTADKNQTLSVQDTIQQRATTLRAGGSANELNHAALLDAINSELARRITTIDQALESNRTGEAVPSPLHVPTELGNTPKTRPLADEYRDIAEHFLSSTQDKLTRAKQLKQNLSEVRKSVAQEGLLFQTLTSNLPVGPREKQDISEKARVIIQDTASPLSRMEEDLTAILAIAEKLDFSQPESIVASQEKSSIAFMVARRLDLFANHIKDLDQKVFKLDLQLYGLIAHLDQDQLAKLPAYKSMDETRQAREPIMVSLNRELAAMDTIASTETRLADRLKILGQTIITQGHGVFQEKTAALKTLLPTTSGLPDIPYANYLMGVREELENQLENLSTILAMSKGQMGSTPALPQCSECWPKQDIWSDMADMGQAYGKTLRQMEGLDGIESFYARDTIENNQGFTHASNLFELSRRLGIVPSFRINANGVDAVFKAGSRAVVIQGIGDANAINIAGTVPESDHLLNRPYIGKSLPGFVNAPSLITPVAPGLLGGTKQALTIIKDQGGKIGSGAGKALDVIETGEEIAGTTGKNFVKNLILKDTDKGFSLDNVSWWNVASYAIAGVACATATAATVGAMAPACAALIAKVGFDAAKGIVDTAKDYGKLSKDQADTGKFILSVLGIITGGAINLVDAGKDALSQMTRIQQIMTFMGIKGSDLKNITKIVKLGWDKIASTLGSWQNLADWIDRVFPGSLTWSSPAASGTNAVSSSGTSLSAGGKSPYTHFSKNPYKHYGKPFTHYGKSFTHYGKPFTHYGKTFSHY